MYYILKDKEPVKATLEEFGKFMVDADRVVARAEIGETVVSTVFLGIDHNFLGGSPLLFETMIFGGEHDQYQDRCSTYEEALKMHKKALNLVTK